MTYGIWLPFWIFLTMLSIFLIIYSILGGLISLEVVGGIYLYSYKKYEILFNEKEQKISEKIHQFILQN